RPSRRRAERDRGGLGRAAPARCATRDNKRMLRAGGPEWKPCVLLCRKEARDGRVAMVTRPGHLRERLSREQAAAPRPFARLTRGRRRGSASRADARDHHGFASRSRGRYAAAVPPAPWLERTSDLSSSSPVIGCPAQEERGSAWSSAPRRPSSSA